MADRAEFRLGNWAEGITERFDLIVSNPPYIAARDPHLAQGDLRFEPAGALTDGSRDGLDSIRAIVAGAPAHPRHDTKGLPSLLTPQRQDLRRSAPP